MKNVFAWLPTVKNFEVQTYCLLINIFFPLFTSHVSKLFRASHCYESHKEMIGRSSLCIFCLSAKPWLIEAYISWHKKYNVVCRHCHSNPPDIQWIQSEQQPFTNTSLSIVIFNLLVYSLANHFSFNCCMSLHVIGCYLCFDLLHIASELRARLPIKVWFQCLYIQAFCTTLIPEKIRS